MKQSDGKIIFNLIPYLLFLVFGPAQAQAHVENSVRNTGTLINFLQVEGLVLGYYPALADGVRVVTSPNSSELTFEPGRKCFENVEVERAGIGHNGVTFEPEDRREVRNKLTGLIGYPGVSRKQLEEDWLRSARGLGSDFYRDNLAQDPPDHISQLLFMPMVLSPKPVTVVKTQWTPEARAILEKEGWEGLEKHCGSHFVEGMGEESFVVYAIRVRFPDGSARSRAMNLRSDSNQTPLLVLDNIKRMRQRNEFSDANRSVTLDVLQVGGHERDVEALRDQLNGLGVRIDSETVPGSSVTRASLTCAPKDIDACMRMAQTFLDFQFGRLNFNGERPAFSPVRFRIAPLKYVDALNY